MSDITLPDEHPGRCRNHRLVGFKMLRCLDYEGTEHTCTFPEPPPATLYGQWNNSTSSKEKPKPWVKP